MTSVAAVASLIRVTTKASIPTEPVAAGVQLAPVLKALADESRLAILLLLAERPRSVAELTAALEIGQTLTSHHLKVLREVGLITATAVGRSNRYAICCDAVADPISICHVSLPHRLHPEEEP